MVVPAYGDQEKLDLTLASLAAQSYPSHLLEVVVVDDGSTPPLRLPELLPERVRLVRCDEKHRWGRGHARRTGAALADGEVVHWLDADMVVFREHVEAQLRWHHLADYLVVLGYKRFIEFTGGRLSQQEVFDAVAGGSADELFDLPRSRRHEWVEDRIDATEGLRRSGSDGYRVHVGATASVTSRLLEAAGGPDESLVLGEDIELGFRLAQQGAVFVPEPGARSWHLGLSTIMLYDSETVRRHNEPYLGHLLPLHREWRRSPSRRWLVPCVDVIVEARDRPYEEVRATIVAALSGTLSDVSVTVVGPWSELGDERRPPLEEPLVDLRLVRAAFAHDERVRFVERTAETSAPAPFRFSCPPGWMLTFGALASLFELAESEKLGAVLIALPEGTELRVARFERTSAVVRAHVVRKPGEDFDDVIHELYGSHWIDGTESVLVPAEEVTATPVGSEEVLKWKRQAERWEAEANRLKRKLQAPLKKKLLEAGRRKVTRVTQR